MSEISGWCEIDHCSTVVLREKTDGDLKLRICQCPVCQNIKVEKWRQIKSYVSHLKTKDPERLIHIAEGA